MKVIVINQNGIIRDVKEVDMDSIVGGYSIVDIRNTKEHSVIDYNNRVVNINTLRVKVA